MGDHPDRELLAAAAAGDPEARAAVTPHLASCAECRDALAGMQAALEAAGDVLATERPGCLAPEVLAAIPPGAEADYPHLETCPLCRTELETLREVESARLMGAAFADGTPVRPERMVAAAGAFLNAAPGAAERLALRPGARLVRRVEDAEVSLEVHDGKLLVEVRGEPRRPLVLVLENDVLERRISLGPGRVVIPAARWSHASIQLDRKGRTG